MRRFYNGKHIKLLFIFTLASFTSAIVPVFTFLPPISNDDFIHKNFERKNRGAKKLFSVKESNRRETARRLNHPLFLLLQHDQTIFAILSIWQSRFGQIFTHADKNIHRHSLNSLKIIKIESTIF